MDTNIALVTSFLQNRNNNIVQKINNVEVLYCQQKKKYARRRRRLLLAVEAIRKRQKLLLAALSNPREVWQWNRTKLFWERDVVVGGDRSFKSNFRMSRKSFTILCNLLKGLEKQDTTFRQAIPLQKRIAVAVYALGSSAEYRTIANLFGISKSTVCIMLREFCEEAWNVLQPRYMNSFPLTTAKVKENIDGFMALGFPQCIGALDGSHIEVRPKAQDAVDYYNYKGWYSTVLLALVDYRYRFMYVNVGSPGRCNDSQIFEDSLLKRLLNESTVMWENSTQIGDQNVPALIIADSAFRLSPHLMKPYPFDVNATPEQKAFNFSLSSSRRVVENAFGHLKARFRRIGKGIDNSIKNAPLIIKVCCVLHNFLNEKNDKLNKKWLHDLAKQQVNRQQPQQPEFIDVDADAALIRNAIADFLKDSTDSQDLVPESQQQSLLG